MGDVYKTPWASLYELWDEYYLPPGRPSRQDMESYKELITGPSGKGNNALVLGATRELRNLLHKLNFNVTIADINEGALEYFNRYVPEWEKEQQVLGDWCTLDFPSRSFDIIVGDIPVANVPLNQQSAFYKNISRMLKDDGTFIHRAELVSEEDYSNDPKDILERYGSTPLPGDYGQYAFELICLLLARSVDRSTNLASIQRAMAFLKMGTKSYPSLEPLYTFNRTFWGELDKQWVFETEPLFLERMRKHFTLSQRRVSSDYYPGELWPTFACKKRISSK